VESVLFLIQTNLEELRTELGKPGEIALTGGLAREPAFVQGLADLSGMPVLHPEGEEATARGVAFLLSEDSGRWPDGHGRTTNPQDNPALVQRYRRWQQAMAKALI
jgi:sugar (pentulose or hexulose) kinase